MRVAIISTPHGFALRVDGRPYTVRGVGMNQADAVSDTRLLEALVEAGGNTIRTWEMAGIDDLLEQAHHHGIAVLVGLGLAQQLAGFDYDDAAAVAQQHARISADVERLREHPALFGWLLGNELNLVDDGAALNPAVWDAVAASVEHVHRIDPDHPVGATLALNATLDADIAIALERAPALDFLGLQAYGGVSVLPDAMASLDPLRPYLVTEFGPVGHWEMPSTDWGREIEEPSGIKADGIVARLDEIERRDAGRLLLGSFAFLWGHKQERTPTWYGMFTPDGRRTATVDAVSTHWTGREPVRPAPRASAITLDGKPAGASVRVAPGKRAIACVELDAGSSDGLELVWELRREVVDRSSGGHAERPADRVDLQRLAAEAPSSCLVFRTPLQPGEYRIFVQANDAHGGAATANLPFLVMQDAL